MLDSSGEGRLSRITIDCPDELLVALSATPQQFEQEARLVLAAKLFEMGRLSSGRAARLAGMDRVTFLLSLQRVGVPALALDPQDLESEARYSEGR